MTETHKICADAHDMVQPRIWNTADVARAEAFDYYREGICAAFMPLRPELGKCLRRRFIASVVSHTLAGGVLNVVVAHSHDVHRGQAEIAASPADCYYLNLLLANRCHIAQAGSAVTLHPGEIALFDGAAAFELTHDAQRSLDVASLMVPKALLQDVYGMRPVAGPLKLSQHRDYGPLLYDAMRVLACSAAKATESAALTSLYRIVLSLAALAAQRNGDAPPASRSGAQFLKLKGIARQHCADADFTITDCAARAGLSVGYVHNLFAGHGERFGVFLLKERLCLAAAHLCDARFAHLPVSAIAHRAGFKDVSHFGRVFRSAYGRSPAAWRRAGAAGAQN